MRGIYKALGGAQTAEAQKDFKLITAICNEQDLADLPTRYAIQPDWGWRKIDKQLAKIRLELNLTIEDFLEIKKARLGYY